MKEITADQLKVRIYENRKEMGTEAAVMAAAAIRQLLEQQEVVNIIFAAAPSQNEFLERLVKESIDWSRINAFHMDEYVGLSEGAPQQFGVFLRDRIFDKVPFRAVYYLNGNVTDLAAECDRYTKLLQQFPADITCMGIGENAHLAFNDPHVANFEDPVLVKVVDLDEACKQQQVNDGCFAQTSDVPTDALTLTIPALLQAKYIYCMVPGKNKAEAVFHTLEEAISEKYPSTILRQHAQAWLFLDAESAGRYLSRKSAVAQ